MATLGQKPRIALIGPVLPFRGGVAQYTTQLHEALAAHTDVLTVSFKRQYPKWLYPGKTDIDEAAEKIESVHYVINVYNPLSWRRAVKMIHKEGCTLAVLDWWTLFWQPGFAYMVRALKRKDIKTVFLCHNLTNHKTRGFMGLIDTLMSGASKWMLKQADAYIVQSTDHQKFIHNLKPGAEVLLKMHPIYDRFPVAINPKEPRGKLEVLFFGFIRPYKGLPVLMEAMKQLQDKDVYLTVVGEPWGDEAELRKELESAGVKNLELNLGYVNDDEAANYFARADVVALPYRSATGSGIVAMAYHYRKPVIATKVGGLKDAVIDGKTGWLVEPESPEELAKVIGKLDRDKCQATEQAISNFCKENSWDNLAKSVSELA